MIIAVSLATVALGIVAVTVVPNRVAVRRLADSTRKALAAGHPDEARALLARWMALQPGSAEAHYLNARARLSAGDFAGVADELTKARELGYSKSEVERLGAIVRSRVGRYSEAEPVLVGILSDLQRRDPEAAEALARVYLETYRLPQAHAVIGRWMRDAPDDGKPYLWLTEIDRRTNGGDSALQESHYRAALERDPNLDKARLGLAELLRNAHATDAAALEYERFLARNPRDVEGLVGAGRNSLERNDETRALGYFDRALAAAPRDAGALKERARLDQRNGRYLDALGRLDAVLEVDPFDSEALYHRCQILNALGRTAEARSEQNRLDRLKAEQDELVRVRERLLKNPQDNDVRCEIAAWMFGHGRNDEALRWVRMVLAVAPKHQAANRLLMEYHERRGETGLANYYRLQAASSTP
jgi:Flp pilus assembly protein TadD